MPKNKTNNTIDRRIGGRVREVRVLKGFTQESLAEAIRISYQQMQKYETGRNSIAMPRLFQIADVLGCTVADILKVPESDSETAPKSFSPDALRVAVAYDRITDQRARSAIRHVAEVMADREN